MSNTDTTPATKSSQFKVAIVPGHLRHIELYCTRMGCQWSSDIDIEQPHLSTLIEVAEMHVQRAHSTPVRAPWGFAGEDPEKP